jgi:1-acyl-sn-glycerol-3-phosphate acyltransferase
MQLLRAIILILIIKPVAYLVLGFSVSHRERLVKRGPAIIAANHNSHLDTLLLFALFPARLVPKLRPVAAADYFMRGALLKWFSINIVGILPIERKARGHNDPLGGARDALERGQILFVFPEGSRGAPEQMAAMKSGIAHLAAEFSSVPVVPIFLQAGRRALATERIASLRALPVSRRGRRPGLLARRSNGVHEYARRAFRGACARGAKARVGGDGLIASRVRSRTGAP